MQSVYSTHHFWFSFVCSFYHQVKVQQRCLLPYLPHKRSQFTDWKTNTIYCYTLTGQQTWAFKDENVLREPIGIAFDKHRNVYVADKGANNVVVLSPDGKNCKQI
jgi:hypothetical protein